MHLLVLLAPRSLSKQFQLRLKPRIYSMGVYELQGDAELFRFWSHKDSVIRMNTSVNFLETP